MDKSQTIGFLLKDVTRLYVARFEQHAQQLSLNLTQCKVLVHLERSEGISQARLAELVCIEPMAMARLVPRMEEEGLIERRPDPQDRRAWQLFLTRKGRARLEDVWRVAAQVRAELFADIPKADRDTFVRVLVAAHDNLTRLETGKP